MGNLFTLRTRFFLLFNRSIARQCLSLFPMRSDLAEIIPVEGSDLNTIFTSKSMWVSRPQHFSFPVRGYELKRIPGLCPLDLVLELMFGAHHLFSRLNIGLAERL